VVTKLCVVRNDVLTCREGVETSRVYLKKKNTNFEICVAKLSTASCMNALVCNLQFGNYMKLCMLYSVHRVSE